MALEDDLRQERVRRWFEKVHGTEQWTILYDDPPVAETGVALFGCLAPREHSAEALDGTDWEVDTRDGTPGMSQYFDEGEAHIEYHRFGDDEGFEPIVIVRSFPNHRSDYAEVVEEFRHVFNLYEDFTTRHLFEIDDAGNEVEAVRMSPGGVEIRTSLLRRYQALKEMDLLLFMVSDVWLDRSNEAEDAIPPPDERVGPTCRTELHAGAYDRRVFSRLRGKKVLDAPPREQCGLWFFKPDDEYISFQLTEDDLGRPVEFTSDPDLLGTYFGANPDSPHYLTPVYFDARVLQKYYDDHERYEVSEGYLRAHGSWGMQLDNDNDNGVVSAWLGDLGRDLPLAEQRHWRGFNILPPKSGVGETALRRQILGQWVGSKAPDHRFRSLYQKLNDAWARRYGWPLFLPLHAGDQHVLASLRLPLDQTDREFDTQLVNLAKLLVDSLNEAELIKAAGTGDKGEKGISKFERYLTSAGIPDAPAIAGPLRSVQGLRSRGAAHRKSQDFDLAAAGLDPKDLRSSFGTLLEQCIEALIALFDLVGEASEQH